MYSIVDIETTGGSKGNGRITEIAIYKFDGEQIVDKFITLINPEAYIPDYITRLTNITNEMVAGAPRFFEVAKQVVEITQNTTFVAHNVSFDHGFIQQEFNSLGYDFNLPCLCTVKLARKFLPGYDSYSLGRICNDLDIPLNGRHRAGGDALATVELFKRILIISNGMLLEDTPYKKLNFKGLNPLLNFDDVKLLPTKCGVYYFMNAKSEIIYVGKSKNIKSRVFNHLSGGANGFAQKMIQEITKIDFVLTGSELIASLYENNQIKLNTPVYNKSLKRSKFKLGIYSYFDRKGFRRLVIKEILGIDQPLASFLNAIDASQALYKWVDEYQLCQKMCGLFHESGSCLQYQLKQCKGACIEEENPHDYNIRVDKFINAIDFGYTNLFVVDEGRTSDEYSLILIEQGHYKGFGYFNSEESVSDVDQFKMYITSYEETRDDRLIISRYLKKNKPYKLIPF